LTPSAVTYWSFVVDILKWGRCYVGMDRVTDEYYEKGSAIRGNLWSVKMMKKRGEKRRELAQSL
jgi:hypothetical protein